MDYIHAFGPGYPEELDCVIDLQGASANCCKFNRWGSLIAVGTTDGRIYVVDFTTRQTMKTWLAHVQPVMALSWSRSGRKLLSGSADSTVVIWEVMTCTAIRKFKYPAMVVHAMFNPRNDNQLVVLPLGVFPLCETIQPNGEIEHRVISYDIPGVAEEGQVTAVSFDRRGQYLITGSSKGRICIFGTDNFKLITHVRQNSQQQIRNILIQRRRNCLVTNSADRIVRYFSFDEFFNKPKGAIIEQNQKFLDIINRASWKAVCLSGTGDFVCAGSTKSHAIYIWEQGSGSLVKILHGSKGESIHDVQWHPNRPVVLSIANGQVSLWNQANFENWSAFAPDFTELEENEIYREKESEFDHFDEDAEEEDAIQHKSEDRIDVAGVQMNDYLCSSDEENLDFDDFENGPLFLIREPIELEPDEKLAPKEGSPRPGTSTMIFDEVESRKRAAASANFDQRPYKRPR